MGETMTRMIIRYKIKNNQTILLSSFGLAGMRRSWFKEKLILKILSNFDENLESLLDIFFEELEKAYLQDSQFDVFTYQEIEEFIKEEELYMLARLAS